MIVSKRTLFLTGANTSNREWLEYDLGRARHITGIQTRGRPDTLLNQYMETFELLYWQNEQWYTFSQVAISNVELQYYLNERLKHFARIHNSRKD